MNTKMTKKEFDKLLADKLFSEFATDLASATDEQIYRALALIVRGMLSAKRKSFMSRTYGALSLIHISLALTQTRPLCWTFRW